MFGMGVRGVIVLPPPASTFFRESSIESTPIVITGTDRSDVRSISPPLIAPVSSAASSRRSRPCRPSCRCCRHPCRCLARPIRRPTRRTPSPGPGHPPGSRSAPPCPCRPPFLTSARLADRLLEHRDRPLDHVVRRGDREPEVPGHLEHVSRHRQDLVLRQPSDERALVVDR